MSEADDTRDQMVCFKRKIFEKVRSNRIKAFWNNVLGKLQATSTNYRRQGRQSTDGSL
jgi:hypothetical protein